MARKAQTDPAVETVDTVEQALLKKYADFPGIAAITRRMQSPEHEPGSIDIRLQGEADYVHDPRGKKRIWYTRWINGDQEGRWGLVTDVKGYVAVKVSELLNANAITGLHRKAEDGADPLVRRGDRGQEVLVKMPLELYTAIKRSQADARKRRARNAKLVKEDLAAAAGKAMGSEAGDMVAGEFDLEITSKRTTLSAELGEEDRA